MSKTVQGNMLTHMASEVTSLATCWILTRQDGAIYYFTDHDADIVYDSNTYSAGTGFSRSAIENTIDLSVDNIEITGLIDDTVITLESIRAGLFDYAEIKTFLVNYEDPDTFGSIPLRLGYLGEVQADIIGGSFKAEIRGVLQNYGKRFIEVHQPECRADLGDSACTVNLNTYKETLTVTAVTSRKEFQVSTPTLANSLTEDWFNYGIASFPSTNNGYKSYEIKDYTVTSDGFGGFLYTVILYLPVPYDITVSDAVVLTPGCNKIVDSDCLNKYNNVINFQGDPFLPGLDQILLYPDAKS